MLRKDFQDLAEERIHDAEALLAAGRYSAARYLAGLAVECALKARIAAQTKEHEFPDKERANRVFTHSLDELLKLAELKTEMDDQTAADPAFAANWIRIKGWKIEWRYEAPVSRADATEFVESVADATDGIMPWLRKRW
jgi:HEPN domain-containing protein